MITIVPLCLSSINTDYPVMKIYDHKINLRNTDLYELFYLFMDWVNPHLGNPSYIGGILLTEFQQKYNKETSFVRCKSQTQSSISVY